MGLVDQMDLNPQGFERPENAPVASLRAAVMEVPGVLDAVDLRLLDYGPENIRGSLYIEVDERITSVEAARIARAAKLQAYMQCKIRLDAVGIIPVNAQDEEVLALQGRLEEMVLAHEHVLDVHAFQLNKESKLASLEVVVDFSRIDREALADELAAEAERAFPGYRFLFTTVTSVAG